MLTHAKVRAGQARGRPSAHSRIKLNENERGAFEGELSVVRLQWGSYEIMIKKDNRVEPLVRVEGRLHTLLSRNNHISRSGCPFKVKYH